MPKPDRRTERTRAALMSAFVHLLLNEGYDAVSVERVAERANVGRSTFYMHFTGKDDILRQSMTRPSTVLAVLAGGDIAPEPIVRQLEHFHQQRARNHIFFAGPVRAIWIKCLAGLIEARLAKLAQQARTRPLVPLPLAALQIAESQIGLIAGWLNAKSSTPKVDAVAEALLATTRALTATLLNAKAPLLLAGEKILIKEA